MCDRAYPDRECVVCGKTFTPTAAAAIVCSDECRRERRLQLRRQGYTNQTAERYAWMEKYNDLLCRVSALEAAVKFLQVQCDIHVPAVPCDIEPPLAKESGDAGIFEQL